MNTLFTDLFAINITLSIILSFIVCIRDGMLIFFFKTNGFRDILFKFSFIVDYIFALQSFLSFNTSLISLFVIVVFISIIRDWYMSIIWTYTNIKIGPFRIKHLIDIPNSAIKCSFGITFILSVIIIFKYFNIM